MENKRVLKILLFIVIFISFLDSKELKIASYNVENLFDMRYNGTEYEEYIPHRHNWTKSILNKKLANISEVICEIDADIIALEEIENINALKLLQKSLKYYGCNYRYSAISHKSRSAIQVAILSKIKIKSHNDIVVTKELGVRNILEAKFIIDSNPLYIFVNHWNSKRSPDSKRILSAKALKKRLLKLPKGSEYIILGDFNTHYSEDRVNSILNSRVLECDMQNNTFQHYNLWLEEPIYRRWSHNFYGKKQSLDAILIPPSLFDGEGLDYVNNSFSIFKRAYLFHKRGYIFRWVYKNRRHKGVGYSDHLPIFAKFSTKPYIKESCTIKNGTIGDILKRDIKLPIRLKRVQVIESSKNSATIQDLLHKIVIFGLDRELKLNRYYDLIVYRRKLYKKKYEIVDFTIEKGYYSRKKLE